MKKKKVFEEIIPLTPDRVKNDTFFSTRRGLTPQANKQGLLVLLKKQCELVRELNKIRKKMFEEEADA